MKLVRASSRALFAAGMLVAPLRVHAGPIEVFYSAEQDPTVPDEIVAPYFHGGGGLFISQDAGKTFNLMCMSGANPKLTQTGSNPPRVLYHDGSIYIASFDGLWKGDKNGCNFMLLPELLKFVSDVASDPLDPKRVYAATSVASPAMNGIYMSDGSTAFAAYGAQDPVFVKTIHVVKNGMARRFYETGVVSDTTTNQVTYSVRVSDDDAKTFTSTAIDLTKFGGDEFAPFSILAIDPTNPDRVIARIDRDKETGMKDTVLESVDAGKSFRSVMELGEFQAATFTPDGKLYFGDNHQDERKLYVMDEAGGDAQLIGSGWKVSCLTWDESKKRMLGCSDLRLGTVDLQSGQFDVTLDMRCAGSFVECPGAAKSSVDACMSQLTAAYCGYGHYPVAPLCMSYNNGQTDLLSTAGYECKGNMVTDPNAPVPSGSGSSGPPITGSNAGSGGSAAAGSQASNAGAGATSASAAGSGAAGNAEPAAKARGGCGCALAGARAQDASATWLLGLLGVLGYGAFRRRP